MTRTTVARALPMLDPAVAAEYVRKRESAHVGRMVALVAGGIPLCFIGPFLITVLIWMFASREYLTFNFTSTFLTVSAVAIPILFLIAAMVKGSILEAGADAIDTDSLGGHLAARRAALPMLILEIGNIGPRMVLHAYRRISARRAAGCVPADRVAQALCTLAAAGGSAAPAKLLLANEPADQLEPLFAVLHFHELVDISKTGDRVWLTTPARTKLGIPSH